MNVKVLKWGLRKETVIPGGLAMPTEQQASMPSAVDLRLQLQIAQVRLEQSRIEAKIKLETARIQTQIKQAKLDHEIQMRQAHQSDFEIIKYAKLIPELNENYITKFFSMFENLAVSLSWPKSKWTIMVQAVLKGKAQNAYADQSSNYDIVKDAVLNAYKLVPGVYRLKFKTEHKQTNQTFVEFARVKRELMNRWLDSSTVTSLDDLKQLILLEEYRRSVPKEIFVYLIEKEAKDIERAAILANEYALNHLICSQKSTTYCKGKAVSNESRVRISPQDVAVSQSQCKTVKNFNESKGNFKLRTCYL